MKIDQLLEFINLESERVKSIGKPLDEERRIMVRTIKLTEEVGELANEVLHAVSQQRADKSTDDQGENLAEEFADVIISAMVLAKALKIDIPKALDKKAAKINRRYITK